MLRLQNEILYRKLRHCIPNKTSETRLLANIFPKETSPPPPATSRILFRQCGKWKEMFMRTHKRTHTKLGECEKFIKTQISSDFHKIEWHTWHSCIIFFALPLLQIFIKYLRAWHPAFTRFNAYKRTEAKVWWWCDPDKNTKCDAKGERKSYTVWNINIEWQKKSNKFEELSDERKRKALCDCCCCCCC